MSKHETLVQYAKLIMGLYALYLLTYIALHV